MFQTVASFLTLIFFKGNEATHLTAMNICLTIALYSKSAGEKQFESRTTFSATYSLAPLLHFRDFAPSHKCHGLLIYLFTYLLNNASIFSL